MRKTNLFLPIVLFLLCTLPVVSAPRLTVVAVVDGMSTDDLRLLRSYWSKGGMRVLAEEAYQTSVGFPHLVYGGNETTATLLTGTTPSEHGYAMDRYFSRADRQLHGLLEDHQAEGIGSALHLSPRALLSPTLTDRLRLAHGEDARIYAVGNKPETTILLTGHGGNS